MGWLSDAIIGMFFIDFVVKTISPPVPRQAPWDKNSVAKFLSEQPPEKQLEFAKRFPQAWAKLQERM